MVMVHGVARWETPCSRQTRDAHLTQFLIAEADSAKLGTGRSGDGDKGRGEIF